MNVFAYDNTFEGLLTLVFDSYQQRRFPDEILAGEGSQPVLFASTNTVETDDRKAERVWNGIVKHSSEENAHRIYRVFLADMPDTPMLVIKYIRLIIISSGERCIVRGSGFKLTPFDAPFEIPSGFCLFYP